MSTGHSVGVVAFVWRTIGRGLVLELAARSGFPRSRCAGCHSRSRVVPRWLDQLREGDVLAVGKLDRLSRPLRDVFTIMERLGEAGAGFRGLTEAIDTTAPAGRMMMRMAGGFAGVRKGDAQRADQGRVGCRPERRSNRWSPPEAFLSTAVRDSKDNHQERQDCRRRCPLVQGLPRNGLPYWRDQVRGRSAAPNSVQSSTPDTLQIDMPANARSVALSCTTPFEPWPWTEASKLQIHATKQ